jgi:beta-carotene 3-hydroxylase
VSRASRAALAGLTALAMEPASAGVHRFLGHGPLWCLHRSHHEDRCGGLEPNDAIPAACAAVAMGLFGLGASARRAAWHVPVAVGMTAYGLAYACVHDLYVHRRLRVLPERVAWLEGLAQAHAEHHRRGEGNWGVFSPLVARGGRGGGRRPAARGGRGGR